MGTLSAVSYIFELIVDRLPAAELIITLHVLPEVDRSAGNERFLPFCGLDGEPTRLLGRSLELAIGRKELPIRCCVLPGGGRRGGSWLPYKLRVSGRVQMLPWGLATCITERSVDEMDSVLNEESMESTREVYLRRHPPRETLAASALDFFFSLQINHNDQRYYGFRMVRLRDRCGFPSTDDGERRRVETGNGSDGGAVRSSTRASG